MKGPEDICANSTERASQLVYKPVQVDVDGSFVPASGDEVIDVEHLLAEPKNEKALEDDMLCLESENSSKYLAIEDFPYPVDYCLVKTESGTLDSDTSQEGKQDSNYEFLDDMLQGVDEEEDLHIINALSSDCAEYLLDTGFVEEISGLDYVPCDQHSLESLGSESRSLGLSERGSGATEISDLSSTVIALPVTDQSAFVLENMTIPELHEAFRSTFGRETSVKDKQWLKRRILFGLQNLTESENTSSILESGLSSNENENSMILKCNDASDRIYHTYTNIPGSNTLPANRGVARERHADRDIFATGLPVAGKFGVGLLNLGDRESEMITQKRLRKPTRRYIEELSNVKSRYCSGRSETSITNPRDKFLQVRSHNQHHRKVFGAKPLVCRQDTLGGSGIYEPFGIRPRRGRPRKDLNSLMGYGSHDRKDFSLRSVVPKRNRGLGTSQSKSLSDMSDDCVATVRAEKGRIRRKHHRLWALSEVMKLIDGVSSYGVGRWTDIKRLFFSSSIYRTSVDLKDKWRNLLRASGMQYQSKIKVERRRKHVSSLPIPQSVLKRVRELAVIHPYPRERKSRLSHAASTTPITTSDSRNKDISRSGRILHKKIKLES